VEFVLNFYLQIDFWWFVYQISSDWPSRVLIDPVLVDLVVEKDSDFCVSTWIPPPHQCFPQDTFVILGGVQSIS
jgi:hypothetical protein